ncbi:MAG: hypothetical protein CVT47_00405 [Thermoplasmata archaeon HGW-Thermoplasmata-2]|nr:MAG: hypothetical protein CVT47_00405 [Thermoplasmata archaeon HGW-Thermoplasmata-2]
MKDATVIFLIAISRSINMHIALKIIGGAVAALVILGATLYFTDYGVEAKITDKGSDSKGNWVEATTVIGGFKIKQYLDTSGFAGAASFQIVQKGNFIVYNINSGHLRMWKSESDYRSGGRPMYESK